MTEILQREYVDTDAEMLGIQPEFDEEEFIKQAKRRSLWRIVTVSVVVVAVAIVVWTGLSFSWQVAMQARGTAIDDYYLELVKMTYPNTQLFPGDSQLHFPGGSREFTSFRQVGEVALMSGRAVVPYSLLGPGLDRGPVQQVATTVDGRVFGGDAVAPLLQFLEPPAGGGQLSTMMAASDESADPSASAIFLTQAADGRRKSLTRLAAAPASSTVEAAVSLGDAISLSELERLVGPDLRVAWAAVRTEKPAVEWSPRLPGSCFGVFFDQAAIAGRTDAELHREAEADYVAKMRNWVAPVAPAMTAQRFTRAADYLEKNGFAYYGVVVVGSPGAVLELSEDPRVTSIGVGAIVAPWD